MDIQQLVADQKEFFSSGATLSPEVRIAALKQLKAVMQRREGDILSALRTDLGKCPAEGYLCEVGMTLSALNDILRHIRSWSRPHRVSTPLAQFPSRSYTVRNPYGVALVMSPWNYPFLLTMEPLIGAVACGNCCVVKPSADAPATSSVMREILAEVFPESWVAVVTGGRRENQALLEQHFDTIFFTGGVTVGKEVMRHAAEHLTPVTLELGGKSPCLIDATADLDLAAKRIAFGKLLNCGQTCVAPDYVLIDKTVEEAFLERLKFHMEHMYGCKPLENGDYVHMVNRKHYDRVLGLIPPEKVVFGGYGNPDTLRIAPTVLRNVTEDDPVMQEEIFGPVLPVLTFDTVEEAFRRIAARPHPLACYLFSQDRQVQRRYENQTFFGGGCINDTAIHLATHFMPFGGVGSSGMGSYHGRSTLETFSHTKSIVKKSTRIDLPMRYAPYGKLSQKLIRLFLR